MAVPKLTSARASVRVYSHLVLLLLSPVFVLRLFVICQIRFFGGHLNRRTDFSSGFLKVRTKMYPRRYFFF